MTRELDGTWRAAGADDGLRRRFADPEFELPVEWLETRNRLKAAQAKQKDANTASRVLVICGSSRTSS